jgi:hypothetical protein
MSFNSTGLNGHKLYSIRLSGGELHDILSQDVSQTLNVSTLAACMLMIDVERCITFIAILIV